jgi:hypothetical protein
VAAGNMKQQKHQRLDVISTMILTILLTGMVRVGLGLYNKQGVKAVVGQTIIALMIVLLLNIIVGSRQRGVS